MGRAAACLTKKKDRFTEPPAEKGIVSRETSSRPPALCPPSNARLKRRRKATELVPCTGSTALRRSSRVGYMFSPSNPQSVKAGLKIYNTWPNGPTAVPSAKD